MDTIPSKYVFIVDGEAIDWHDPSMCYEYRCVLEYASRPFSHWLIWLNQLWQTVRTDLDNPLPLRVRFYYALKEYIWRSALRLNLIDRFDADQLLDDIIAYANGIYMYIYDQMIDHVYEEHMVWKSVTICDSEHVMVAI